MALTQEQIDALEATHKRIAHLRSKHTVKGPDGKLVPEWEVVFRKPTRAEHKRFRGMIHDEGQKADATEALARTLVVYPTREAFDALLEDYPGIADGKEMGQAIMSLSGMAAETDAK